ncbi:conjugal transfer protein [Klebsiella sp. PL-2018]|uniref:conjugal transfer protein n=1 Tax=Klebsiella TaxID=570 RepID=UPI001C23746E|nr:conjugal transfer protein [Klebsiella sp. PL-2018]QXD00988.1 IncI1 plasmid conjugative transfer protein TraL [Klebsiella sp. PL-2018]
MTLRKGITPVLLAFLLLSAHANAATCRAATAAQAGSQAGYERARTAAQAWSQRENDVASSLQSCLSKIKKTTISLPQFPNLNDLLEKLGNEVCDAVVDRVNDKLPGNIDPWKSYGSSL